MILNVKLLVIFKCHTEGGIKVCLMLLMLNKVVCLYLHIDLFHLCDSSGFYKTKEKTTKVLYVSVFLCLYLHVYILLTYSLSNKRLILQHLQFESVFVIKRELTISN